MCHDFFLGLGTKFCSFERVSRICSNVDFNLPAIAEKLAFLFCVCLCFFFKIYDRLPDVNNVDIRWAPPPVDIAPVFS